MIDPLFMKTDYTVILCIFMASQSLVQDRALYVPWVLSSQNLQAIITITVSPPLALQQYHAHQDSACRVYHIIVNLLLLMESVGIIENRC